MKIVIYKSKKKKNKWGKFYFIITLSSHSPITIATTTEDWASEIFCVDDPKNDRRFQYYDTGSPFYLKDFGKTHLEEVLQKEDKNMSPTDLLSLAKSIISQNLKEFILSAIDEASTNDKEKLQAFFYALPNQPGKKEKLKDFAKKEYEEEKKFHQQHASPLKMAPLSPTKTSPIKKKPQKVEEEIGPEQEIELPQKKQLEGEIDDLKKGTEKEQKEIRLEKSSSLKSHPHTLFSQHNSSPLTTTISGPKEFSFLDPIILEVIKETSHATNNLSFEQLNSEHAQLKSKNDPKQKIDIYKDKMSADIPQGNLSTETKEFLEGMANAVMAAIEKYILENKTFLDDTSEKQLKTVWIKGANKASVEYLTQYYESKNYSVAHPFPQRQYTL